MIQDKRWVLLEEGYPHTILLNEQEANAMKQKWQMVHPKLKYSVFYDEYYEFVEFYSPEGLDKERQRHREKYFRLNYKDKHKQSFENKKISTEKHKNKYPEKYIAKNISQRIKLVNKNNHKHHWNYNIEFAKDIIELNIKDHNKIHRFIKYDKKTFMYKDLNGNLLDTKEKHLELINKVLINF